MKKSKGTTYLILSGVAIFAVFAWIAISNYFQGIISSNSFFADAKQVNGKSVELKYENKKLNVELSGKIEYVCIKETRTSPSKSSECWKEVEDRQYSQSIIENKTYYIWLKDSDGNISNYSTYNTKNNTIQKLTFLYGDVNLDGKVSSGDVTLVNRNVVSLESFGLIQNVIGDVDFDGIVTIADSSIIMKKVMGNECFAPSYSPSECKESVEFFYGDINLDGTTNMADVSYLLKYLDGNNKLDDGQKKLADVNLDGKLTCVDASIILSYIVGKTKLPNKGITTENPSMSCVDNVNVVIDNSAADSNISTNNEKLTVTKSGIDIKLGTNYSDRFYTKDNSCNIQSINGKTVNSEKCNKNYDGKLGFFLHVPENATKNMPLLVFIHGEGERGKSGLSNFEYSAINRIKYYYGDNYPVIIFQPNLDSRDANGDPTWSDNVEKISNLIKAIADEYYVDKNNIVLVGHSLGASGAAMIAKNITSTNPNYFSKLILASAGTSKTLSYAHDSVIKEKITYYAPGDESAVSCNSKYYTNNEYYTSLKCNIVKGAEHTDILDTVFNREHLDDMFGIDGEPYDLQGEIIFDDNIPKGKRGSLAVVSNSDGTFSCPNLNNAIKGFKFSKTSGREIKIISSTPKHETVNYKCEEDDSIVFTFKGAHPAIVDNVKDAYRRICKLVSADGYFGMKLDVDDITLYSGLYQRTVTGGKYCSAHAYGVAQDINYEKEIEINGVIYAPWESGESQEKLDTYKAFIKALGGNEEDPRNVNYILYKYAFGPAGFEWGGTWSVKGNFDPMHFEAYN